MAVETGTVIWALAVGFAGLGVLLKLVTMWIDRQTQRVIEAASTASAATSSTVRAAKGKRDVDPPAPHSATGIDPGQPAMVVQPGPPYDFAV